jgi:Icc-related predicted phosphoesterase
MNKKTLKVLHSSDLHGRYDDLFAALNGAFGEFDIWIDTGDFLPNRSWANHVIEVPFQSYFFSALVPKFVEALKNKRFLYVPGNHDFIKLSSFMKSAELLNEATVIDIEGVKFTGFRYIGYIIGDWEGEIPRHKFTDVLYQIHQHDAHVLLTHTPPGKILDAEGPNAYGVDEITQYLQQNHHKIQHHFFGHVHGSGGQSVKLSQTTFYNGACNVKLYTIEVEI